jgi:hypothetical protein
MALLESLEPELDTAAITGGNPAHRVLLVANTHGDSFTGWARLAVDFQTRSRYAIQISSACGDICSHIITDEVIGQPSPDTGKFRWAFTLWFAVNVSANTLEGFLHGHRSPKIKHRVHISQHLNRGSPPSKRSHTQVD